MSAFNNIVHDRLVQWIVANKADDDGKHMEERVYEWGDASYLLQNDLHQGSIRLSLSLPDLEECSPAAWGGAYKGIATPILPPAEGYTCTLDLNLRMLSKLPQSQRDFWLKELASLRLHVCSTPLRWTAFLDA